MIRRFDTYININDWCYNLLVGLLLNVEQRVFYSNIFQQLRILRQVRKNLWKITSIDWQWLTDMGKLLPWENPLFTLTYIERCINFDIILSQKHIYNKILSWNYMQLIIFFLWLRAFLCNLFSSIEPNRMLLHMFNEIEREKLRYFKFIV